MPQEDKSEKIAEEVRIRGGVFTSPEEVSEKLRFLSLNHSSTTEIIEVILSASVDLGASDIHFEPSRDEIIIRFRLDGVLRELGRMKSDDYHYIVSRIKLLSGIKFNLEGSAADGRFTIKAEDGRDIEVRVAVSPSEYGEAIIARVLDPRGIMIGIPELGLREDDYEIVKKSLSMPSGAILVTGPTGSGKTTTLYSFLQNLKNPEIKIITIEDPIEYHLEGIQQTQVNAEAGYTFDNGLRSILRQDPDVILVGEIRDLSTAEIAMHASLTGHLVFSTLHTNSAAGAVPRLIDVGVKPQIIGSAVSLIIAQRLVRKLCPYCREEIQVNTDLSSKIEAFLKRMPERVDIEKYAPVKLYGAKGCDKCHGGYKGRVGIFELFELTRDYENVIRKSPSEYDLELFARTKGFTSLEEDGILKGLSGITSLQEVERVTGPINW